MPSRQEVRAKLERLLEKAKEESPGSHYRIVENADGTIDAEFVIPVERGERFRDRLTGDVEATFRDGRLGNTWVSSGLRFEPSEGRERLNYSRYKGNYQVFTHYTRDVQSANATVIEIEKEMHRKRLRKPHQAVVRIHWNQYGLKPPREDK